MLSASLGGLVQFVGCQVLRTRRMMEARAFLGMYLRENWFVDSVISSTKNVLILNDELGALRVRRELVEDYELGCHATQSPAEALRLAGKHRFSLAFIDLGLGANPHTSLQKLRQMDWGEMRHLQSRVLKRKPADVLTYMDHARDLPREEAQLLSRLKQSAITVTRGLEVAEKLLAHPHQSSLNVVIDTAAPRGLWPEEDQRLYAELKERYGDRITVGTGSDFGRHVERLL